MPADNSAHLSAAARARADEARRRTRDTLRRWDRSTTPISVTAVAAAAGVSRTYLYSQPDLLDATAQLKPTGPTQRVPRTQRISEASLRARLETATERTRQLRQEVRSLRNQLAVAHAELRKPSRDLKP